MVVLDFIESKPFSKDLLYILRELIISSVNGVEEVIKYRTPFYTYHGFWIYLIVLKDHSVNICFAKGYLMEELYPQLVNGNRKYIRSLNYKTIDDINVDELLDIIQHSISLQKSKK